MCLNKWEVVYQFINGIDEIVLVGNDILSHLCFHKWLNVDFLFARVVNNTCKYNLLEMVFPIETYLQILIHKVFNNLFQRKIVNSNFLFVEFGID